MNKKRHPVSGSFLLLLRGDLSDEFSDFQRYEAGFHQFLFSPRCLRTISKPERNCHFSSTIVLNVIIFCELDTGTTY